jgi:DNA replication protein DnaC
MDVGFFNPETEMVFKVISRAYKDRSLMLIANLAFEEWTEIFGSERLTGALLDRLTHRCHILEENGESYRLRHARKRSPWKPSSRQDSNPKEKDK